MADIPQRPQSQFQWRLAASLAAIVLIGVCLASLARIPVSVPSDTINLNQISPEQLALKLEIDLELADLLIKARERRRGFQSVAQALRVTVTDDSREQRRWLVALKSVDFNELSANSLAVALRVPLAVAERIVQERTQGHDGRFAGTTDVLRVTVLPQEIGQFWYDRLIVRSPLRAMGEQLGATALFICLLAGTIFWNTKYAATADQFVLPLLWTISGIAWVVLSGVGDPLKDQVHLWPAFGGFLVGSGVLITVHHVGVRRHRPAVGASHVPSATVWWMVLLAVWAVVGVLWGQQLAHTVPAYPWLGPLLATLLMASLYPRSVHRPQTPASLTSELVNIGPSTAAFKLAWPAILTASVFLGSGALGPAAITWSVIASFPLLRRPPRLARYATGVALAFGLLVGIGFFHAEARTCLADWLTPTVTYAPPTGRLIEPLWALASGGLSGSGLGLGSMQPLPGGDGVVYAVIGEHLGFVGCLAILTCWTLLLWRLLRILPRSQDTGEAMYGRALTLWLATTAIWAVASATGVVPRLNVPMPFAGCSRLLTIASMGALGYVLALDRRRHHRLIPSEERIVRRHFATFLTGFSVLFVLGLGSRTLYIQGFAAERIAGQPLHVVTAESSTKEVLNPRVAAIMRSLERGTIFDVQGRVVATSRLREMSAALPGRSAEARRYFRMGRYYPYGTATAPIVGIWKRDAQAAGGVEQMLDEHLRGFARPPELLKAYQGKDLPAWLRYSVTGGGDVLLSMDAEQLKAAYAILERHAQENGSPGEGFVVVLNAVQGHPVVAVATPTADPNEALLSPSSTGMLMKTKGPLDPWPAPSLVLKVATALATPPTLREMEVRCTHVAPSVSWRVGNTVYHASNVTDHPDDPPHGRIGLRRALKTSCNIFFAELAARIGPSDLYEKLEKLGLATALADRRTFSAQMVDLMTDRQRLSLSPLHVAALLTSATAASAPIVPPLWFELRYPHGGPSRFSDPAVPANTLPELTETAPLVREVLREAVRESSLSEVFRDLPFPVAGRTAIISLAPDAPHYAWFVGFAPADRPAFVVVAGVRTKEPGYRSAAPLARDILRFLLP